MTEYRIWPPDYPFVKPFVKWLESGTRYSDQLSRVIYPLMFNPKKETTMAERKCNMLAVLAAFRAMNDE